MSEAIIHGIDMYRFPRAVPEDVEVIDTFPLRSIPEQLDMARTDVLGQLTLAQASFSGRQVACVLAGEDGGYGGHVIEHSRADIEDPFLMALDKVPHGARLYGIIVAGEGAMKEKHVMPSGEAYDKIAPLLLPGSPIVVIPPNSTDTCRVIPEVWHRTAYEPKVSSVFQGRTVFESQVEAIQYTALSPEDCEFVAHLRHAGLDGGIHYYLTGSANGQGGPSVALRPGMYSDLDILAVGSGGKEKIEAAFEAIAQTRYGELKKEPKTVRIASGDMAHGCVYSNDSGVSIDFYATDQLERVLVRPEYLQRNYFHQLS